MSSRLRVVTPIESERAPWWDVAVVVFMILALVALMLYLWLVPPAPLHPRAVAVQVEGPRPRVVVSRAAGACRTDTSDVLRGNGAA